jgi:hypothetical protein
MPNKYVACWVRDLPFWDIYFNFGWHWLEDYASLPVNRSYLRDYPIMLNKEINITDPCVGSKTITYELAFFMSGGRKRRRLPIGTYCTDKPWRY